MAQNHLTEIKWGVGFFFFLLFVTTNADTKLGTTYLLFLLGAFFLLLVTLLVFDKRLQVTVKKSNKSNIEELFVGAVGWIVLLAISFIILNVFSSEGASFGAIMNSLNAANPIFSDSITINFLVIAFAIPFIETVLWGRGAEFLGDIFKVKINNQNKKRIEFVIILIVLSAIFAVFHATAKQLAGQSLMIVAVMMGISLWLIATRDGDMRASIFMHIIANGVAAALLLSGGGLL